MRAWAIPATPTTVETGVVSYTVDGGCTAAFGH